VLALLLLILGTQYTTLKSILGILGGILGIFGYFDDHFSGILVYHYPPPRPTLNISKPTANDMQLIPLD